MSPAIAKGESEPSNSWDRIISYLLVQGLCRKSPKNLLIGSASNPPLLIFDPRSYKLVGYVDRMRNWFKMFLVLHQMKLELHSVKCFCFMIFKSVPVHTPNYGAHLTQQHKIIFSMEFWKNLVEWLPLHWSKFAGGPFIANITISRWLATSPLWRFSGRMERERNLIFKKRWALSI
mgnify:CR=1 FL=1